MKGGRGPHGPHRGPKVREEKPRESLEPVMGLRAGLAVFDKRRADIVRIAFTRVVRDEIREMGRWATGARIPCVEMSDNELDRAADSTHHEGLVVITKPRRWASAADVAERLAKSGGSAIALDRVRNPYNVGAILRSAAFFGVDAIVLGTPAPHPGLPPIAVRVAEGGAESLMLARTTDLADTLARLKARGAAIVGTDGRAEVDALGFTFARSTVLVMGNEREGLGDRVRAQCDALVAVKGAGAVESLNVAVTTGVLVAQMTRRARAHAGR